MRKFTKSILLAGAALLPFSVCAKAQQHASVLDISQSITDNAIVYPESFESDTQKLLEGWYMKNYTATDDRYKTLPNVEVSDEVIIKRLQALPTIIEMPYNQIVKSYIDRYLTGGGRSRVAALLGLSHYYMPIFEQALEQEGLPLELKYLPLIESSLDPNAVSKHGAAGLWQFMLGAAKGFGMEVNSLVDERRDPYISSEKAATFLKDLYATYGDWSLAIAAYNSGPGTVNKAIRRAGGDPKTHNFWSIYNYLPSETRGYVPMFIAANYVMNYYQDHNISPVLATKPLVTDTVAVNTRLHFNQISKVLDIPVEELRILNPQFRADIIPASPESPYYLILPSQQIHAYIMSEDDIRNYDADKYAVRATAEPGVAVAEETLVADNSANEQDTAAREVSEVITQSAAPSEGYKTITHKVGPGESLASIAEKYNVSPQDLKAWNSLRRNAIRTGQQLRVQVPASSSAKSNTSTPSRQSVVQSSDAVAQRESSAKRESAAKTDNAKTDSSKADAAKAKKDAAAKKEAAKKEAANKEAAKKKKEKAQQPTTHNIKEGENLSTIAKKYGVSVEDIKKANNMDGDAIRAGKNLKIPAKASSKKGKSNSKSSSSSKKSGKKKRR
jgi:membrane-bound lytic murein transglycosylase D